MNEPRLTVAPSSGPDDRLLWDLESGFWRYLTILVAHDLKLFTLLAKKPQTLAEVCAALTIESHPAAALLNVCISAGLVQRLHESERELYALTAVAIDFLVEGSPTYS